MTNPADPFANRRRKMVAQHIEARGIRSSHVLEAMLTVPREEFVAPRMRDFAYEDRPLPIGLGQTISQPYVVALMIEAAGVAPGSRVLDVGTGSGYAAALLACIAAEVISIEWHRELAERARAILQRQGLGNVTVITGDGSLGSPEHAPFDAILVAAGSPNPPAPLLAQLAEGARLVMPVGTGRGDQNLVVITKNDGKFTRKDLGAVAFVPLLGTGSVK